MSPLIPDRGAVSIQCDGGTECITAQCGVKKLHLDPRIRWGIRLFEKKCPLGRAHEDSIPVDVHVPRESCYLNWRRRNKSGHELRERTSHYSDTRRQYNRKSERGDPDRSPTGP